MAKFATPATPTPGVGTTLNQGFVSSTNAKEKVKVKSKMCKTAKTETERVNIVNRERVAVPPNEHVLVPCDIQANSPSQFIEGRLPSEKS